MWHRAATLLGGITATLTCICAAAATAAAAFTASAAPTAAAGSDKDNGKLAVKTVKWCRAVVCWHGLPWLCSRLLPLHLSNHFRSCAARRACWGYHPDNLLLLSPPPLSPAAYAKPKQKRKCIIKKIKKLATFFFSCSACTKRKLPHGKRRQGGGQGGEAGVSSSEIERASVHTHTHPHINSLPHRHTQRESVFASPHPRLPTARSWHLQQDKPISICFKCFANQKPSKRCSSCNCHMRVSSLALSPWLTDCVWICVACVAFLPILPQLAKVFGHPTQNKTFPVCVLHFCGLTPQTKLSITPQYPLCLFMNFADSCCVDGNFKSYTTWRIRVGQQKS